LRVQRLRIANVEMREDLSGHCHGDAGGRSIAEIEADRSAHLQPNVIRQPGPNRRHFFEQPLQSMRRPEGADVRQLSPGQQRQHARVVLEAVRHQYRCRAR